MADSDADRLAGVIAMIGSSHEGEAVAAMRAAGVLLKKARLSWVDVGQALVQRDKLLTAAKQLQSERDAALGEVERLKRIDRDNDAAGALSAALWIDTRMPRTVENRHAAWVRGLGMHLTEKESGFLDSCASRRGRLSPAQRDWLADLVRRAIARTGQAPPP
jgi:hypothetical protein